MLTRRQLLTSTALLAVAAPARAEQTNVARSFIERLVHELVGVVNGAGSASEKHAALAKLIDRDVDVAAVARFCLGRFWRVATTAQQHDFTALFGLMLAKNVTGDLGEYQGVTIAVGKAESRQDGVTVSSVVTRPNDAPNQVDWLVSSTASALKIIDLVVDGISLRLTQRSDIEGFLTQHNDRVQALTDAIRKQTTHAD